MATDQVSAVLIVGDHRLVGMVRNDGHRLLDLLNAPDTQFLELVDVALFDRSGEVRTATLPGAIVRASNIAFAALISDRHEAPENRVHLFAEKQPRRVFVAVPGYEVRGVAHVDTSPHPELALAGEGAFFPVTEATTSLIAGHGAAGHGVSIEAPVVIVNSALVSVLQIGEPAGQRMERRAG